MLATNSLDDIARDFNYDLLKLLENKILDNFTDHAQIVNRPVHISGSLIDHFYINKTLMQYFPTNATVENVYFSGHDSASIVIEKNDANFCTIPLVTFSKTIFFLIILIYLEV